MARYIIVVVAMATAISLLAQQISSIKNKPIETKLESWSFPDSIFSVSSQWMESMDEA